MADAATSRLDILFACTYTQVTRLDDKLYCMMQMQALAIAGFIGNRFHLLYRADAGFSYFLHGFLTDNIELRYYCKWLCALNMQICIRRLPHSFGKRPLR